MDWLTGIDGWMIYLAVGLLAFGESAAFLGLIVPGEVAMLAAGASAAVGGGSLGIMIGVALVGALLGAVAGYAAGVRWGPRMLRWRPVERRLGASTAKVLEHLHNRGGIVVVLSRFNSVTRALVPALAGSAGMPLRRFVVASAVGGAAWAVAFLLGGFLAGASWRAISAGSVVVSAVVLVALAMAVVVAVRRSRSSADRRELVGAGLR